MNACFLYVDDENPEMLAGIEPKKISNWQRAVKKACKTYFDLSDNMTNAWCIVGGATQKWANKVYPDMSNQEALEVYGMLFLKQLRLMMNMILSNYGVNIVVLLKNVLII